MLNFKKLLISKVISLVVVVTFSLTTTVYGIDLSSKTHLRVQVGEESTYKRITEVIRTYKEQENLIDPNLYFAHKEGRVQRLNSVYPEVIEEVHRFLRANGFSEEYIALFVDLQVKAAIEVPGWDEGGLWLVTPTKEKALPDEHASDRGGIHIVAYPDVDLAQAYIHGICAYVGLGHEQAEAIEEVFNEWRNQGKTIPEELKQQFSNGIEKRRNNPNLLTELSMKEETKGVYQRDYTLADRDRGLPLLGVIKDRWHQIARLRLNRAIAKAKEKGDYDGLKQLLKKYRYEEDIYALLFDESPGVRTIVLNGIVESPPQGTYEYSLYLSALEGLYDVTYFKEGHIFFKPGYEILNPYFCDATGALNIKELFSKSGNYILFYGISLLEPEIVDILFRNEVFLQAVDEGGHDFLDNFETFIASSLSILEVGTVEALVGHPSFKEILSNRKYAWNFLHYSSRLLTRVTPEVAFALMHHQLFQKIIELNVEAVSAEHVNLSTLALALSRVVQVEEGKLIFRSEYNGLTSYFCHGDRTLALEDLVENNSMTKVFDALSKLDPETIEAFLEAETRLGDILKDSALANDFVAIASNLDNWYKRNPVIIQELESLYVIARDFPQALRIFDVIKFKKGETVKQLLKRLKEMPSSDVESFQPTLYLFMVFCKNGLIPEDITDELLISLFQKTTPQDFYDWLRNEVVKVLRDQFDGMGIAVEDKDWHDVLIRSAIGFSISKLGYYSVDKDAEFSKITYIMEHLGAKSGNIRHFVLDLCYAVNLRYFSSRIISELPKGFAYEHDFTTDDVWSNAHAHEHNEANTFSIGGSIFALSSELSHVVRYIFEGKIYNVAALDRSAVTHEVADRIGVLAIEKNSQYLHSEFAKDFVEAIFNFSTNVFMHELDNRVIRSEALRQLRISQDKFRYDTSQKLIKRGRLDEFFRHLRPSEIYWLGRKLYKTDLPFSDSRTMRFKDRAIGLEERFTQEELDNIVGIMPLSTMGIFGLREIEIRSYEEYAGENIFSAHLKAESLSQDFALQLLISLSKLEGIKLSVNVLPYLTAKAFEFICEKLSQKKIYEDNFLETVVRQITPEVVEGWINDLIEDGIIKEDLRSLITQLSNKDETEALSHGVLYDKIEYATLMAKDGIEGPEVFVKAIENLLEHNVSLIRVIAEDETQMEELWGIISLEKAQELEVRGVEFSIPSKTALDQLERAKSQPRYQEANIFDIEGIEVFNIDRSVYGYRQLRDAIDAGV